MTPNRLYERHVISTARRLASCSAPMRASLLFLLLVGCAPAGTQDRCASRVCNPSDDCHAPGVCDPKTGECSNPAKTEGSVCDDGNKCTNSDSCRAGVCVGSNPVRCTAGDQCHIAGSCDPSTGLCSTPAKVDSTPCDDGDLCTLSDTCLSGVCVGGLPVTCTAIDQCHLAGKCEPSSGVCSNPKKGDGASCDAKSQCLEDSTCRAGVCSGGRPLCFLSYHNDPGSTGLNPNEKVLTPANVTANTFGKLFSVPLDGPVYAQPLYVVDVNITVGANKGLHDVVYVATQHNSLYAIDAANGIVLWQQSFIDPDRGVTTVPALDVYGAGPASESGITATPVIDSAARTLYLTAKTKEILDGDAVNPHYVYRLHAVDLGDGTKRNVVVADTTCVGGPITNPNSNKTTCASYSYNSGPFSIGTGDGFVTIGGDPRVYFNAMREMVRTALVLHNGLIFIGASSHADGPPWHGWILAYDSNLSLTGALNTTPNTYGGAIWQSAGKMAVDPAGFIYVMTGNGQSDPALDDNGFPNSGDYPEAFLKIALDPTTSPAGQNVNGWGLKVVDYFMPFNHDFLDNADQDLGSGAPLILPDGVGPLGHPNLLIGVGKEGRIYVLDRDKLGRLTPNGPDAVVQELNEDGPIGRAVFNTPSYFDDGAVKRVFFVPATGSALAFTLSDGLLSPAPTSQSTDLFSYAGPSVSLSCSSDKSNAILWTVARGANELRAYDPADLTQRLYRSSDAAAGRDQLGIPITFTVPTVAGGRVFVGTVDSLVAYGLLSPP